jgi:hypothetical protein
MLHVYSMTVRYYTMHLLNDHPNAARLDTPFVERCIELAEMWTLRMYRDERHSASGGGERYIETTGSRGGS